LSYIVIINVPVPSIEDRAPYRDLTEVAGGGYGVNEKRTGEEV
jgi:hypothetical protein